MNRSLAGKIIKGDNKTIKVKSLSQPEDQYIKLPEIYVHFDHQTVNNKLNLALCDSGAEACILGYSQLLNLGFNKKDIHPCQQFNIQSSTETRVDCIRGTINVMLYCLMINSKNKQKSRAFLCILNVKIFLTLQE